MAKHKLLLADDSVTIQKVVNLTFSDEGIEVITAGDGNAAMEKFVEFMPDLVMVDVNMPGFDGYRICEMIKQDEETRHIPVVLLVGSFEPFDEAEARRVGADDYLTKPFQSIRQLVSRVADLLNNSTGKSSFSNQAVFASQSQETSALSGNIKADSEMMIETNYANFDDANFDDGMIQTDQIGSLPADETQKFVSESYFQTTENDFALSGADKPKVLMENQPYSLEDFDSKNTNQPEPEDFRLDEKIFDFADEPSFAQNVEPDILEQKPRQISNDNENTSSIVNSNMATKPENDITFDFDDLNLLDLPPPVKKTPIKAQPPRPAEETVESFSEKTIEAKQNSEKLGGKRETIEMPQLSPEIIEAITRKIIEKLSDKVIKDIAREVTSQMAESIIKEMTQNKTNSMDNG